MYICGASKEHIEEEEPFPENTGVILPEKLTEYISPKLPLYISIDKDVLLPLYAQTDWDQGEMTLATLLTALESLNSYSILGVDICGDKKTEHNGSVDTINKATDLALLKCSTLSHCRVQYPFSDSDMH